LFHAMGRSGAMSGALQDVLRAAFPVGTDQLTAGSAVALPGFGQALPAELPDRLASGGCFVLGDGRPVRLLSAMSRGHGIVWAQFDTSQPSQLREVRGLDPGLGLIAVELAGLRPEIVLTGEQAEQTWSAVQAAGRRALAHQLVGAVERMLELAVQHALDRVQFGRQVGSFQAVRHRLADAFVAKEAAAAAVELSWCSDDEVLAAMLAKSLAGRAAKIAATQCQQVLAGIGFTAEHPFHRYLKRVSVLDRFLGSATELPALIGARLIELGALPRLVEL
ncbi:MAG: hypothetical protein QOG99_1275, partial [Frankiales bacterium]|nr:hypothetical protein [Frankiales bacterium]